MAITYNNIPTTGKWGDAVSPIEDNFSKTSIELARLDVATSTLAVIPTFKDPVATFSSLATTYPTPEKGWSAMVEDVGFIYQYNGTSWANTGLTAFPTDVATLTDLSGKVDKKIIYNVTEATGVTYTTKTAARDAVTSTLRGLGQIITYKLTTGWVTEQYIGTDVNNWSTESNWNAIESFNSMYGADFNIAVTRNGASNTLTLATSGFVINKQKYLTLNKTIDFTFFDGLFCIIANTQTEDILIKRYSELSSVSENKYVLIATGFLSQSGINRANLIGKGTFTYNNYSVIPIINRPMFVLGSVNISFKDASTFTFSYTDNYVVTFQYARYTNVTKDVARTDGLHYIVFNTKTNTVDFLKFSDYVFKEELIIAATLWYFASTNTFTVVNNSIAKLIVNGENYGLSGNNRSDTDYILNLPDKFFTIKDEQYTIDKDNVLLNSEGARLVLYSNGQIQQGESITIDNNTIGGSRIAVIDGKNRDYVFAADVNITQTVPNPAKSITYCQLGDSLTNYELMDYLKSYSDSKTLNISTVGTKGNQTAKGEGRAGWTAWGIIGKNNALDNRYIKPYESGDVVDQLYVNPFLKLADANDKANYPDYCFRTTPTNTTDRITPELSYTTDPNKSGNFYIFDWTNYVNTFHSGVYPQSVSFALAWNDFVTRGSTDTTIDQIVDTAKFVIKRILEVAPTTKIGLIPANGYAYSQDFTRAQKLISKYRLLIPQLKVTYPTANIELIGVWTIMPRVLTYPLNAGSELISGNTTKKFSYTDSTHFNNTAKRYYVKELAAWLVSVM